MDDGSQDISNVFDRSKHFMHEPPRRNPLAWIDQGLPSWFDPGDPRGLWLNNETFRASVTQVYLNTSFEIFRGRLFGTFGTFYEERKRIIGADSPGENRGPTLRLLLTRYCLRLPLLFPFMPHMPKTPIKVLGMPVLSGTTFLFGRMETNMKWV